MADAPDDHPDRRWLGVALAAGGMLGVSFDSPLVRVADVDGWTASFWYGVFATPVLLTVLFLETGRRPMLAVRRSGWPALGSSFLMAASGIAFVIAITLTEIANVVVIVATTPVAAAIASSLLLGERTSRSTWIAIAGAVLGVAIVVSGSFGSGNVLGDLLALVAVSAFAVNLTLFRRQQHLERSVVVTGAAMLTAIVCVVPATPFGHQATTYLALAAMGGVTGVVGRLCLATAPLHLPAPQVSLFTPVETVAATAWGWIFFDEAPPLATWIGGTIILAFVAWGTWATMREPAPTRARVPT